MLTDGGRLVLAPPAKATGQGDEEYEASEDLKAALTVLVDALAGAEKQEGQRFLTHRRSWPVRLAADVGLFNQDYFVRPIMTADSTAGGAAQAAVSAGRHRSPEFLQPFTGRERPELVRAAAQR